MRGISGFRIARKMVRREECMVHAKEGLADAAHYSFHDDAHPSLRHSLDRFRVRTLLHTERVYRSSTLTKKTVFSFKLNLPKLSVVGVGSMSDRIPIVVVGVDTNTHAVLLKSNAEEVF